MRVWLKHRNFPGLAISRSYGDSCLKHCGVIHEPEIDIHDLDMENDEFIINEVRTNMLELGYIEAESPDSTNLPDLVLAVSAVTSDYYYY